MLFNIIFIIAENVSQDLWGDSHIKAPLRAFKFKMTPLELSWYLNLSVLSGIEIRQELVVLVLVPLRG